MRDRTLAHQLGNRHLQPELTSQLGVGQQKEGGLVRVTLRPDLAETTAGQHLTWMLVNLLARQYGVIDTLELDIPKSALHEGVAPLFSNPPGDLQETLARTVSTIAGSAIDVSQKMTGQPDFEVIVGRPFAAPLEVQKGICAIADGWKFYVGLGAAFPCSIPTRKSPVGPYFAACVIAGEVFKALFGMCEAKGRQYVKDLAMSLWNFGMSEDWLALSSGPPDDPVSISPFYLVGAGAVGQSVACVLGASTNLNGYCTIIDSEEIDKEGTNLNRYVLATLDDRGHHKHKVLSTVMERHGFKTYGFGGTWQQYTSQTHDRQRGDLRALERDFKYQLVLSCVDNNSARHSIQKYWPETLLGGSTLNFGILTTAYNMRSVYECLMCSNPIEAEDLTIENAAKLFKSLSQDQRERAAENLGIDIGAVTEYLDRPKCGSVGEMELQKFRDSKRRVIPSVGFVSVAAGVVLAAQLIKNHVGDPYGFPCENGNSLRFNFLNPVARWWARHLRRKACECGAAGIVRFQSLWGR